eukprot:12150427-Alexandrium_andersonii.AAC.1
MARESRSLSTRTVKLCVSVSLERKQSSIATSGTSCLPPTFPVCGLFGNRPRTQCVHQLRK